MLVLFGLIRFGWILLFVSINLGLVESGLMMELELDIWCINRFLIILIGWCGIINWDLIGLFCFVFYFYIFNLFLLLLDIWYGRDDMVIIIVY